MTIPTVATYVIYTSDDPKGLLGEVTATDSSFAATFAAYSDAEAIRHYFAHTYHIANVRIEDYAEWVARYFPPVSPPVTNPANKWHYYDLTGAY